MATRGWGGSVVLAIAVAGGSAAAQLGLGYGLGIVSWTSATDTTGVSTWLASLAWTAWIAATSTVLGAVAANRLFAGPPPSRAAGRAAIAGRESTVDDPAGMPRRSTVESPRPGVLATGAWRLAITLTASVGALITVPLVAVPARAAHRPDTYAPQLIAGGYAIVGIAIGLVVALAALSSRAISANVVATTGWLWALAIASAVYGARHDGLSTAQLAVWRFGGRFFLDHIFSLPGAALMMGAALLVGVLAAWPGGRRGDNRIGVAVSGAAGPLLVAGAYFLAAPKLVGVHSDDQLSAYLIAPYAVVTGLAGSVLLSALLAHREQRRAVAADLLNPPAPLDGPAGDGYELVGGHPAGAAGLGDNGVTADLRVPGQMSRPPSGRATVRTRPVSPRGTGQH